MSGNFTKIKYAKVLFMFICLFIIFNNYFLININFLNTPFSLISNKLTGIAFNYLPKSHSAILNGMLFGDSTAFSAKQKDFLKKSGTIHVVVVSGYNISVILTIISNFIDALYIKVSRLKRYLISQIVIILYLSIIGWGIAATRAYIMFTIIGAIFILGRKLNILYVLAISACFMISISFELINDVSFQFSFFATLGLILFSKFINNFLKFFILSFKIFKVLSKNFLIKLFGKNLCETLSASIFVYPLISFYFGNVSIVSPIVNGLVLWTVPIITIYGIFCLAIAPLSDALASTLFYLEFLIIDFFLVVTALFAKFPFSSLELRVGLLPMFLYYFIVLFIVIKKKFYEV